MSPAPGQGPGPAVGDKVWWWSGGGCQGVAAVFETDVRALVFGPGPPQVLVFRFTFNTLFFNANVHFES